MAEEFLSQKMQEFIHENETLRIEVDQLKKKIQKSASQDFQIVKEERDELQKKVQLMSAQLSERSEQLKAMDSIKSMIATTFNTYIEKLKETGRELPESLRDLRRIITEKDTKNERLEEVLKENALQKQSMSTKLTSAEADCRKKGNELGTLRAELETIQKERDDLLQSSSASKGAVDVLQQQVDQLLSNHDALICENEELRRVAKGLPIREVSLDNLEVQHHVAFQVAKATSSIETKLKLQIADNENLRREMESMKRKLQGSDSSSVVAKSNSLSQKQLSYSPDNKTLTDLSGSRRETMQQISSILSNGSFKSAQISEMVESLLDEQEHAVINLQSELTARKLEFNDKDNIYRGYIKRLEDENKLLETKVKANLRQSSFLYPTSSVSQLLGDGVRRNSMGIPQDEFLAPYSQRSGGITADTFVDPSVRDADVSFFGASGKEVPPRQANDGKSVLPKSSKGSSPAVEESGSPRNTISCPRCTFKQSLTHKVCNVCGSKLRI